MKNNLNERLVSSNIIYKGDYLTFCKDVILTQDDKETTREYIKHGGAVAIIPLLDNNKILFEYQYRYPVKKVILEIPAGRLNVDESVESCAKRELHEETGYIANELIFLGTCLPCIGYSDEIITYFIAKDLVFDRPKLDDHEFIETIQISEEECFNKIFNNEIIDSKTITGMMLYLGYKKNKNPAKK